MKKNIILVLAIMLLIAVGFIWYISRPKDQVNKADKIKTDDINLGSDKNEVKTVEEDKGKFVNENFTIKMPQGWEESIAPAGVSLMAINAQEEITDSAAKEINFRSYFSVTHDTNKDLTKKEYLDKVKSEIKKYAPSVVYSPEEATKIDEYDAYILDAKMEQRGVNFQVLIVIIYGENNDVWAMSFNTIESNWDKYVALFNEVAQSFALR